MSEYKPTDLRIPPEPFGEFCYTHGEEMQDHECVDETPTCNVCQHPIHRLGSDWVCTEGCKCLMIGCVPSKKQN